MVPFVKYMEIGLVRKQKSQFFVKTGKFSTISFDQNKGASVEVVRYVRGKFIPGALNLWV